jgi:hypothetical protein
MPTSPFTITTGSNTVVLNSSRQGEAAFTATNISGRPLRGRGELLPLGQTAAGWLTIVGEAERDFGIAAAQQYAVQVAVPLDAAPGLYTFRLDMVGVDNPDENFTQGPVVQFQVLPPPPPPPPPQPFPWWIVAVVAGVIVIGVIIFLLTRPRNFGGIWQSNFAQLNLAQNGATISGTAQIYGNPTLIPITGTIKGGTLTGLVSTFFPYTLTLAFGDGSFDGTVTNIFPWCGVRSGALPAGCGFSGHWNMAGTGQAAGASADLTQTDRNVTGSFVNGTVHGQVTGVMTNFRVSGQWTAGTSTSGMFAWALPAGRGDQFSGNMDGQPWCGFRNGSVQPTTCLATIIAAPEKLLP